MEIIKALVGFSSNLRTGCFKYLMRFERFMIVNKLEMNVAKEKSFSEIARN